MPVCVSVAVGGIGAGVLVEVGSDVFVSSGVFEGVGVLVDTINVFVIVGVSPDACVAVGEGDPIFVGVEVGVAVDPSVPGIAETGSV